MNSPQSSVQRADTQIAYITMELDEHDRKQTYDRGRLPTKGREQEGTYSKRARECGPREATLFSCANEKTTTV